MLSAVAPWRRLNCSNGMGHRVLQIRELSGRGDAPIMIGFIKEWPDAGNHF